MTAIVGLVHRGTVWLGSDSAISHGDNVAVAPEPKVAKIGNVVLGVAGDVAALNMILHLWQPPRYLREDPHAWCVVELIPSLRQLFRDFDAEPFGEMLVGVGGELRYVDNHGATHGYATGRGAVGSGRDYALGSLCATERLTPRARIARALEAAELNCGSVRGPWHFVHT